MIKRDNLLENAIKTGAQLREGLNDMAKEFPEWVKDVRGRGTCLSFSVENEA
jgi:4-aminobutyrate aminotransferase-like enzyme